MGIIFGDFLGFTGSGASAVLSSVGVTSSRQIFSPSPERHIGSSRQLRLERFNKDESYERLPVTFSAFHSSPLFSQIDVFIKTKSRVM